MKKKPRVVNEEALDALRRHPKVAARLRVVREFIRRHPQHLHMGDWIRASGHGDWGAPTCGTTACIVGWYAVTRPGCTVPKDFNGLHVKVRGRLRSPSSLFLEDLGFVHGAPWWYSKLTNHGQWPEPFQAEYFACAPECDPQSTARPYKRDAKRAANIAAKRITHFLNTGL